MPTFASLGFLELGWLKEGRGQRVCVVKGRGHNGAWSLLPLPRPPVEGRAPGRVTKRFTRAHEDLVAPQIPGPWDTPFADESWQPDRIVLEAAHLAWGRGRGPGAARGRRRACRKLGQAPAQGGASQGRAVACSSLTHSPSLHHCVAWVRVTVPGEPAKTKHTALPSGGLRRGRPGKGEVGSDQDCGTRASYPPLPALRSHWRILSL